MLTLSASFLSLTHTNWLKNSPYDVAAREFDKTQLDDKAQLKCKSLPTHQSIYKSHRRTWPFSLILLPKTDSDKQFADRNQCNMTERMKTYVEYRRQLSNGHCTNCAGLKDICRLMRITNTIHLFRHSVAI